jgi:hypothetical protein
MVGSWQGRRECPYQQIRARLRTPPGAVQRGPAAQCFIVKGALNRHKPGTVRSAFDRYVRRMDEARAVIHRLERIEALEREGAGPKQLLAEVRELLREGEAWLEAEGLAAGLAAEALERCRLAHDAEVAPMV